MNNDEAFENACHYIKQAYLNGDLPELLGRALEKEAVLVAAIDVCDAVMIVGSSKPNVEHPDRNNIMIKQMALLLEREMKSMMKLAGKIDRGEPAELMLVHADGGDCHGKAVVNGRCLGCGHAPDTQSTELWPPSEVKP